MRKLIILVVAVSIIPLVKAITLFGEEVSTLVLIPSALILIILIVFILIIIKDKIKSRSIDTDLKLEDLPEPGSADLTATPAPPSLEPPPIETPLQKEPMPKTLEPIQKPKIDYLKEIELLEKEPPSKNVKDLHKKLNELIRRFFLDYMGINYNFTFEELEKELKKGNKRILCFSDNLSSINYGPEGISKGTLIELIKEFKDIVISSTQENQLLTPKFEKEVEEKKKKINILLKKGKKLIEKDINKAKEKYKEISELYKTLPDKEKESIRPSIINFYNNFKL